MIIWINLYWFKLGALEVNEAKIRKKIKNENSARIVLEGSVWLVRCLSRRRKGRWGEISHKDENLSDARLEILDILLSFGTKTRTVFLYYFFSISLFLKVLDLQNLIAGRWSELVVIYVIKILQYYLCLRIWKYNPWVTSGKHI